MTRLAKLKLLLSNAVADSAVVTVAATTDADLSEVVATSATAVVNAAVVTPVDVVTVESTDEASAATDTTAGTSAQLL